MTTTEMLAYVEAQIRKDIPRLMELREGLLVQEKYTDDEEICKIIDIQGDRFVIYNSEDYFLTTEIEETLTDEYEIIGHDIMLNDVLEWFRLNEISIIPQCSKSESIMMLYYVEYDEEVHYLYGSHASWRLSSPYLKDQSEELIKFLYNIAKDE